MDIPTCSRLLVIFMTAKSWWVGKLCGLATPWRVRTIEMLGSPFASNRTYDGTRRERMGVSRPHGGYLAADPALRAGTWKAIARYSTSRVAPSPLAGRSDCRPVRTAG